jgi:Fe-S cluster assembly protein SufB
MANYTENELAKDLENQEYKFGFVTDIETEKVPIGLNEDIIRLISSKKNEPTWLLDYRLNAFETWKKMVEPEWAHVRYEKPKFQEITLRSSKTNQKIRIMGGCRSRNEGDHDQVRNFIGRAATLDRSSR